MNKDQVTEKVIEAISDKYGILQSEITDQSNLQQDLKLDSLDMVDLEIEMEKVFGIQLNLSNTTDEMQVVEDIVKHIIKSI
jgi:acyl carrier protein